MTVIKKIKENLFLIGVALIYIVLFIFNSTMGVEAIKNSGYYIKEMLMIMPVIFILTALLDMWVPKAKIMEFLGQEAGSKGVFLSFVVGSISAGPIYAAFPMCVMLRKKGASIRNIIIILSSWAVIKVPMLLNEAKFLGFKFMVLRWILTVLAILLFSRMAGKIIKEEDMVSQTSSREEGLYVNREACMGCSICRKAYPDLFEMEGKKAKVRIYKEDIDMKKLRKIIEICPVKAIDYYGQSD